ncbi:hypothetical protein TNCV_1666861 [Trichonephila clavipes]|nr:hypothetical protein TNCV_1666861 [Trichonephila clavipes]
MGDRFGNLLSTRLFLIGWGRGKRPCFVDIRSHRSGLSFTSFSVDPPAAENTCSGRHTPSFSRSDDIVNGHEFVAGYIMGSIPIGSDAHYICRDSIFTRWCVVVVLIEGASSDVTLVTGPRLKMTRFIACCPRIAVECDSRSPNQYH